MQSCHPPFNSWLISTSSLLCTRCGEERDAEEVNADKSGFTTSCRVVHSSVNFTAFSTKCIWIISISSTTLHRLTLKNQESLRKLLHAALIWNLRCLILLHNLTFVFGLRLKSKSQPFTSSKIRCKRLSDTCLFKVF